jgi:MtN3 and saliva related transmembrane protein
MLGGWYLRRENAVFTHRAIRPRPATPAGLSTMTPVTIIGSLAALLTTVAYVPQAYQTIRTRDTSALSLPTFLMLFVGTCLWGTYAVLIHDIPILLTNLISGGLATIILYIKLTTKPDEERPVA